MELTDKKHGWRWAFLKVLAETCCVSKACVAAKVSRQTAYNHRKRFPRFRAKWDEAIEVGIEVLEAECRRRALNPADPASHTLLMFLLKAHRPEKYRERWSQPPDGVSSSDESRALTPFDLAKLSPRELDALESIVAKLAGGPGEAV